MADDSKAFRDKKQPYQFYLPIALREKGVSKAEESGVKMAPFMVMAWEQFCERDIQESMKLLKAHKRRNKRKKVTKVTKGVTLNK